MSRWDVAVIGGGMAGATLAYWLTRRAGVSVVVFEREPLPGMHSTGRNAALMLQNDADPLGCRLAMMSRAFYVDPPEDLFDGADVLRPVGSLRLASGPGGAARLERDLATVRAEGLLVEWIDPAAVAARIPRIDPARIAGAAWCPGDGTLDIHGILNGFVRGAARGGARFETGVTVTALSVSGGRVTGLETDRGPVAAGIVVDASGGWAARLAAGHGVSLPLRPTRRHLAVTTPLPDIDPDAPFVWDVDTPFYFRPESGGLLLCACDQDDAPGLEETVHEEMLRRIADRATALLPGLAGVGIANAWAGIRTLTPDDHAIVGLEPRLPGLAWFAGLGGHGMSCGPALARIAADAILGDRPVDPAVTTALAPGRFSALPAWGDATATSAGDRVN